MLTAFQFDNLEERMSTPLKEYYYELHAFVQTMVLLLLGLALTCAFQLQS